MKESVQGADARAALTELEVTEDDARAALLQEARRFMQFALAGEAVFWVLLFTSGPDGALAPLSIAGYVCAWGAAVMGVSRGARAIGMNPGLRIAFYVLAFAMFFRLVPIAYFLGRSTPAAGPDKEALRRQRTVEQARQRARERQQEREQAAAAPTSHAGPAPTPLAGYALSGEPVIGNSGPCDGAKALPAGTDERRRVLQRLSKALPRVRLVQPLNVPDGTPLKLRMAAKPGSALVDTDAVALPAMRATGGVFGVMYMVDEGDHYTSINQSELEAVGMTLDSLHRLALNNLKKLVQGDQPGLKFQPGPLLKMFMMGGDFESSLVLVDELWDVSVPHETPGDLNICIAARDICIYCSAQSTHGLARLREIAKDLEQRSPQNFISTQILRRARGRWSIVGSATSPA